jgi:hypothetical protein
MVEFMSGLMQVFWSKGYSGAWKNGLSWSGLRGAVSIVLALGISGVVPNSELIIAITFGIVIFSNFVQGTSMSILINDWNLTSEKVQDEISENLFSEKYVSIGYESDAGLVERVLFCAPEFFVMDTGFGSWLSTRLVFMIDYLNKYSIESISRRTVGFFNRFVTFLSDILIGFLAWVNQFLLRWDLYENNQEANRDSKDSSNQ